METTSLLQGSLFLLSVNSIGKKPLGERKEQVEAGAEGHHLKNITWALLDDILQVNHLKS